MEWMTIAAIAALIGMMFGWFVAQARAQSDAESKVREAEARIQDINIRAGRAEAETQNERFRREASEEQRMDLQARCDDLHERLRVAENGFAETRALARRKLKSVLKKSANSLRRRSTNSPTPSNRSPPTPCAKVAATS